MLGVYKRLADGHATNFVQSRPRLADITDWLSSPRREAAILAFRESAYSKKPGRVVKRVSKYVRPAFDVVHLAQWDKVMKAVFAVRLASVRETDVFAMHADEEKVFPNDLSLYLIYCCFLQATISAQKLAFLRIYLIILFPDCLKGVLRIRN
ncbi:hypothetical protein ACFSHP_01590 [Novosphingobium panipatense]